MFWLWTIHVGQTELCPTQCCKIYIWYYSVAFSMGLLGSRLVSAKDLPRLYNALQMRSTISNCRFSLLQSAVSKLSPQLGGDNNDIVGDIDKFSPEDGEEIGAYFSRVTRLLQRRKQLALLPNDTRSRLLHKWLEGLIIDPCIMPLVTKTGEWSQEAQEWT